MRSFEGRWIPKDSCLYHSPNGGAKHRPAIVRVTETSLSLSPNYIVLAVSPHALVETIINI